jgi:hypothetical protein
VAGDPARAGDVTSGSVPLGDVTTDVAPGGG